MAVFAAHKADSDQLADLPFTMNDTFRFFWQDKLADSRVKLDDVGDALLHALDELLCGSNNFHQLPSTSPALHNNKTVGLAVYKHEHSKLCCIVPGWYKLQIKNCHFKDESTVEKNPKQHYCRTPCSTQFV